MPPIAPRLASTLCGLALIASTLAHGAPVTYDIDPTHTYPSFEADHMGLSTWRGKLNKSTGTIVYDKASGAGSVAVQMDLASIDFGLNAMNAWARGPLLFNVEQNPVAVYKGRFNHAPGAPSSMVQGELTLNGRTVSVPLTLHHLKCMPHPLFKREVCGADASGQFNREDFGLSAGKDYGFKMDVKLQIQVEAVAQE